MMLTKCCKSEFLAGDRERGELLYQRGHVELTVVGRDGAMAIVEGSMDEDYVVGVDYQHAKDGEIGVHCDCPRFDDGYACKHLWATLRQLDAEYEVVGIKGSSFELSEIDISMLEVGDELHGRRTAVNPIAPAKVVIQPESKVAAWKQALQRVTHQAAKSSSSPVSDIPRQTFGDSAWQQQHWFVLSLAQEANEKKLKLEILRSTRKADGQWSKPIPCNLSTAQVRTTVDASERAAFSVLVSQSQTPGHYSYYQSRETNTFEVDADLLADSLRLLQATGRFAWKLGDGRHFEDARPIQSIDVEGGSWRVKIELAPSCEKGSQIVLTAALHRGDARIPLSRLMLASDAGYAIIQSEAVVAEHESVTTGEPRNDACVVLIDADEAASLRRWQQTRQIIVPRRSLSALLGELAHTQSRFELEIDPALEIAQTTASPLGRCLLKQRMGRSELFDASVLVRYDGKDFSFDADERWWWDASEKRITHRDAAAERQLLATLPGGAFRVDVPALGSCGSITYRGGDDPLASASLVVTRDRFIEVVETLRGANWEVLAEGSPIRIATDFDISVNSGTDWFDLSAEVNFDGITASLPQLLAALRSGNHTFVLDDGTVGMLPEAWLRKFAGLQASGETTENGIRFSRTQALLLDAMLSEQEDVRRDVSFTDFCDKLKNFAGISPVEPPESFVGTMRPYQQLGLGWFEFLREFRFGGCLADDMGLGKTIQVLALLESRRVRTLNDGETHKPSFAVVPKSLIFNWIDEAKRFTPNLRVLNYTGTDRTQRLSDAGADPTKPLDLILTTYGTLRRDAAELRDTEFDYVILDEAQAIKNPRSQAAKASRLLRGEHRLAMTGTPVENHLGDLWSLFDFLNPGMLGHAPRIAQLPDDEDRKRIMHVSQSLRPFILRRTKSQVLTELPEKVEQTLSCEMEPKQRKLYDQLKEHYRLHLSQKVKELGLKRAKIHVLEALLRLRQAACDPRLVNPDCGVTGAKIVTLMEQLDEIIGDGHKVLVFSQFTKLLALVRKELESRPWAYEYLDGKTNHRSEHVRRFQEDDDCKLFLISLKAGGNGLNLTAADYVFILDPWWNPAVEAQAIDRAHRMGQTQSVMAYRMICEDTVEEKIIELQQSKRDLADAIISQDKTLISELTADDLQQLLM